MLNSGEKASVYVSLVAALLAATIAFGGSIFLWYGGDFKHLKVQAPRVLPLMMPSGSTLSEIWFSPSGTLLASFEHGKTINIASWDLKSSIRSSVRPLDFSPVAGELESFANSFHGGSSGNSNVAPDRVLAYSVSNDSNSIAWVWRGQIFMGPTNKFPKIAGQPLHSTAPVSSVAIARPGVAMVVDTADRYYAWDFGKKAPLLEVPFKRERGPRLIWGRGDYRTLSSTVSSNTYLFSAHKPTYNEFPVISGGASFAATPEGRAIAGTLDGIVIVLQQRGPSPFLTLPNIRRVLAVASYDEDIALAGGDGGTLFLIKNSSALPLTSVPEGIRFLSVNREHIAYATSDRIVLGGLAWEPAFSERAKRFLTYMFSAIGLIGFLRVIVIDVIKLAFDRRERRQAEQPSQNNGAPAKDAEHAQVLSDDSIDESI